MKTKYETVGSGGGHIRRLAMGAPWKKKERFWPLEGKTDCFEVYTSSRAFDLHFEVQGEL